MELLVRNDWSARCVSAPRSLPTRILQSRVGKSWTRLSQYFTVMSQERVPELQNRCGMFASKKLSLAREGEALKVSEVTPALSHLRIHHGLANKVLLEVLHNVIFFLAAEGRLEGGRDRTFLECHPVQAPKELVPFDLVAAGHTAAQARIGVPLKQCPQEFLGQHRDVIRVCELPAPDAIEKLLAVLGVEGRQPCQHLVGQGSD
mmetsp:Transcript_16427/g.51621  ORF Transcript_16427/g.51621 Transcript_16427/m.51621 type:complete len:204 (-) Transcript_16427:643-1254(-)